MRVNESRVERNKKRKKEKREKKCKKFIFFLMIVIFLFALNQVNISMHELMRFEEDNLISFDFNSIIKIIDNFQNIILKTKHFIKNI